MSEDTYKTIVAPSEGIYTEKRSKFIAIALPVRTVEEAVSYTHLTLPTSDLVDETVTFLFEYPFMNDVMRVVKEEEPEILEQSYDMDCRMTLRIRQSMMPKLRARLEKVETLRFE